MESLISFQIDINNRIAKGPINLKKSPKDRITREYLEGRLETLEQLWSEFLAGHKKLIQGYTSKELNTSLYVTSDVYDSTEETYYEYKGLLKNLISLFEKQTTQEKIVDSQGSTQIKLPKIQIPTFSGNYSEWTSFKDLFQSLIINNSRLDNVQKLHYLKGFVVGEADQLLRHIPTQECNFERCWELLNKRYNNKKFICNNTLKRLFNQKCLTVESANGLKVLVDTTNDCLATLSNIGIDIKGWDVLMIHILTSKLDAETRRQWEFSIADSSDELPSYRQFEEFLSNRFRAIEFLGSKSTTLPSQVGKVKALHVANTNKIVVCPYCKANHKLFYCKEFQDKSVEVRRNFVLQNDICFRCMGSNHSAKSCRSPLRCRTCKRRHNTLLHPNDDNKNNTDAGNNDMDDIHNDEAHTSQSTPLVSCVSTGKVQQQVLLATALVKAMSKNGVGYNIRALLDQGSQSSFVAESTVQYLGLKKLSIRGNITGLGGAKKIVSKAMVNIDIQSRINPQIIIPVRAYVLKNITSFLPTRRIAAHEWEEFNKLSLADPEFHTPNRIDVLLGAEVYSQVLEAGIKKNANGRLVAQSTSLGWIVSGLVSSSFISTLNFQALHCCMEGNELLKRFWELESDIQKSKEKMFTDDEMRCEQHFTETVRRDQHGRYVVRLPFRNGTPEVTSSQLIAERRLRSLEHRLNKDKLLKNKYQDVIDEYLSLDHMRIVPYENIEDPHAVYLPHHAVVREDKETTKVRVVFDASCKGKNNMSLNDQLLVGPTLQPELRHLIMQWRIRPICISADIVKMYRQVKVDNRDADCQRILWREDNSQGFKHYKHTRVTFGTASAPYLAVKALQQVAQDHGTEYPLAAERVLNHFYVDDLMTGVQNLEEGKIVYKQMNDLLGKAGFEMQKWNSNNDELVEAMRGKDDNKEIEENLKIKEDKLIKILGLTWNRTDDTFRYVVSLPQLEHPVTKRKIISDISRLYDPLGWLGPTIIIAKVIIQKLWLAAIDWDEEVPNSILKEWLTYREEQIMLNKIRIPRWLGIETNEESCELHGFCDASKTAYAAVVYTRVLDNTGKVTVNLVTAKTKVAPVKQVSIPRLELCGAVLLSKLLVEVAQVLNIERSKIHAWTDSTVVLAWLNNHPSKWTVFVANRVSEILTTLEPTNWSHIASKQNPADCASRGLRPSELVSNMLWFKGPEFISREPITYHKPKEVQTDMEAVKVNFAITEDSIWDKFSSLSKTLRVLGYCRRFIMNSHKAVTHKITKGYLTARELFEVLSIWIKRCQEENFPNEIKLIKQRKNLSKTSKLQALNPFLDEHGILRIGGRLAHSMLCHNRKHPILIPKNSHLTELIIANAHHNTLHGGLQLMLTYLQSKYWIIGAKQLVKAHYRQCVTCIKNAAATKSPLMGQLPMARVTPTRPFSHSGVDYAGPILMRNAKGRGHSSYKGYICLFVCMATRAIHLEVVSDLSSEGFLQAFKRFVSRRGHCSHIWSDNGTNFVGAAAELKKCGVAELKQMQQEVAETLAAQNCEWHFIPPHSPNFGGLWEAGIRSVKYHLKRVIGNSTLTYEEMATVLTQVEACLNSRPMSTVNTQPDSDMVLTPGHFLVGEALLTPPDYNFEWSNIGTLRRWQHTQRMMQSFWRQWSQEYLRKFLSRPKWSNHMSNVNIGDVVVVKEDNLPPCKWLYGRIIATHPGKDQIVRVVTLKTKSGTLKRPVSKLCTLPVL